MQRYAKICKDIQRYTKICRDMQRYAKICKDMQRYAGICKSIQRYNLYMIAADLFQPVKGKNVRNGSHGCFELLHRIFILVQLHKWGISGNFWGTLHSFRLRDTCHNIKHHTAACFHILHDSQCKQWRQVTCIRTRNTLWRKLWLVHIFDKVEAYCLFKAVFYGSTVDLKLRYIVQVKSSLPNGFSFVNHMPLSALCPLSAYCSLCLQFWH